jgi:soluble lytic murein transglycosylase-like protein
MITRVVTILTLAIVIAGCTGAPVAAPSQSPSASPSETATPTAEPTPAPTATPPPDWNSLPEPALDPDTLARQLAFVESAIRDPNVTGPELAYVGHMQQLIIARLRDYPDWLNQVVAGLPAGSRDAVLGTYDAGRQLRMIPGPIPRKLPDWQILEPKPIDTLLSYYKEAQTKYGVEWQYLAAIHLVESRVGRIHGLSTAGAQGPMQFIPSTWAVYGTGDINDDHDSILAAARYLKAAGAPGDMRAALLAYNHSTAYVNALIAYATVLKAQPDEYRGYHGWQVYYTTQDGTFLLPVGWTKPAA